MVNTLRLLSLSCGLFLIVLSGWAMVNYGSPVRFLPNVAAGMTILLLPRLLAYAKLWLRRGSRYLKSRQRGSDEVGATFVSEQQDPNPDDALSIIVDAVSSSDEEYSAVRWEQFSKGNGLMVTHGGFHNSFIRLTDDNRLVVTGASTKTHSLAQYIGNLRDVTMENQSNNPLLDPIPVRGAPRWFLGLFLVALLIIGVGGVANAAYPTDTYNTVEKTVLVSYDAQMDFNPKTTSTSIRIEKAEFIVGALSEEAVEIQWEKNGSSFLVKDGKQAIAMSKDVRRQLRAVRDGSLSAAQQKRTHRVEAKLHVAEHNVVTAIRTRIKNETAGEHAKKLRSLSRTLNRASNRPA